MARPSVELVGLKQANAALRKLPEFAKLEAQQVSDTTAFQMSRKAIAGAPEDTGNLKRKIRWESRPRTTSAVVGVEPDAFYWKFNEYGTVTQPARPFMRPAADALREDHDRRLLQALEKAAMKVERAQGPVG